MGQIGGTWYWAPGDNISSLKTGLGEITLEGFYGTPQDRPGHSGEAKLTGSTGFGNFNIKGTAALDRHGKVFDGKVSGIEIQILGSGDFKLVIGYSADGPYATVSFDGITANVNIETDGLAEIYDAIGVGVSDGLREQIEDAYSRLSEMGDIINGAQSHAVNSAFQQLYDAAAAEGNMGWPQKFHCFLADTPILLANRESKAIQDIVVGDIVLSYDKQGNLVPGKVTRTFQNNVKHLLDVHGLKVTPGHVTLCGDGKYAGRHVPIIDILLSDGALVRENGDLIRMSINKPVSSVEDHMVQVLWAETAEDIQTGNLQTGKMRVGTLLFDRDGVAVSVLDCLQAEGLAFDPETGLINHSGQAPTALHWFGRLPRPVDYILRRSRETLEGILTDGEWEAMPSDLIAEKLRMTRQMQTH